MAEIKKEEIKKSDEPKAEEKEETITIKKSELQDLMDRITRVESASEKSRLASFDEKNKKQGNKIVKLRIIEDNVILSWDNMVADIVEKNTNGVWGENQIVKLNLEDDSSLELPLSKFVRHYKTIPAEVLSKSIENQGTSDEQTILKVRTEDGKEYLINKRFVN